MNDLFSKSVTGAKRRSPDHGDRARVARRNAVERGDFDVLYGGWLACCVEESGRVAVIVFKRNSMKNGCMVIFWVSFSFWFNGEKETTRVLLFTKKTSTPLKQQALN